MSCPICDAPLDAAVPGWCPSCGTAQRVGARDLLGWLVPDFGELPTIGADADPLVWPGYADRRAEARSATGLDEAVLAVDGSLADGPEVVAVAWDFRFFGGSMSSAVGQTVAAAIDHAREHDLPVVLLPATGGARMQEGMASLVQMAATTVALTAHGRAGLLSVSVLRDPTTGGVFASHANLTDVVLAEPGATIGFAGPRVAEAMTGGPLPEGSHTAAGARAAGLVDAVVPRPDLPVLLARLTGWPGGQPGSTPHRRPSRTTWGASFPPARGETSGSPSAGVEPEEAPTDAWEEVQRARAEDRPRAPDFLRALDVVMELRGDRSGSDDGALRVVLARLDRRPVVVIAMDTTGASRGRVTPAGYRKAWRGVTLAARLGVPILTLVDTPGADASASSEAGGIAHHIAATFARLLGAPIPVVALVIGEGGSGGALALGVADRLLIQEHAVFSVIAPEGAAAILHRDASKAPVVAPLLHPTSHDLERLGIADEVIAEPAGAQVETALAAVARHLDELAAHADDELVRERGRRWRTAGHGA